MPHESSPQHILPDELTDYFATVLPPDRESEIEEHLAVCAVCTEQARHVHTFSRVWDSWTARAHGAAAQQAALATALRKVQMQTQSQGQGARLQRWREGWAGRAGAAVRLVVEAPGRASRLVTQGLEALAGPGGMWDFALAGAAPMRVRGGRGRGATRTRGQSPAMSNTPQAWLQIQGTTQRSLQIHVEGLPPGPPPLVLLIPMQADREPQIAELELSQAGASSLVARFADVVPGDYMVAFEPLEHAET